MLGRYRLYYVLTSRITYWKSYNAKDPTLNCICEHTKYLCHKWPRICSVCRNHNPVDSSFMTFFDNRVCNKCYKMDTTCGAGTAYPSGALEFIPGFSGIRVARSLVFCEMFCRSLFVLLSFFFWPLHCLSFFDLRFLVIPLVSSNFYYRLWRMESLYMT